MPTSAPSAAGQPPGDNDNIGRALGAYVIERRLGHGGMGTVYLARRADREFERQVAIKMIRGGMDSELVVRRFRHERQILATLDHPHIAALFDGGTTPDGLPYFVMEYVDGTPIDRYADEHMLKTADRLRLCLGVVDAVQHAHDHHVVHRDLKPGNVLVTADGQPKLLDFGIAKILDAGADRASTFTSVAGAAMTPDYASPEQVLGRPVTPATDVYALGLLLYELLTGHRPYRLTTHAPEELVRVVCEQDPERPSDVIQRVDTVTHARRFDHDDDTGDGQRDARRLAGPAAAAAARRARRHRAEGAAQGAGSALPERRRARRRHPAVPGRGTGHGRSGRLLVSNGAVDAQASRGAGCGGPGAVAVAGTALLAGAFRRRRRKGRPCRPRQLKRRRRPGRRWPSSRSATCRSGPPTSGSRRRWPRC